MKIDFGTISHEEFEYLCEDILKAKGFTVKERPARGPDGGKDIIVVRDVTDDMGISFRETWLVECKHFSKSNKSVKEADIGNIEARMKVNGANRYLLITSTTVSESARRQISVISSDSSTPRMGTFWSKTDLIKYLEPYDSIQNRFFFSYDKQATMAANEIRKHHYTAHRGAILWSIAITVIFENRNHNIEETRAIIKEHNLKELSHSMSEDGHTYVILIESSSAREIHEIVWSKYPEDDPYTRIQKGIAFERIWQFWRMPMNH